MKLYKDRALTLSDLLGRLERKGMVIDDPQRVERYLTHVGYHRLGKYFSPFYVSWAPHFKAWTSFDRILSLYIFDRKLRALCLDALERIEVAARSVISNVMSVEHGPHWFLNYALFIDIKKHKEFIEAVERAVVDGRKKGVAVSIQKYAKDYNSPYLPPSWVMTETLTFGVWSKVYSNISDDVLKQKIADSFCMQWQVFEGWLRTLAVFRNICAHHRRLWNKDMQVFKPFIPKNMRGKTGSAKKVYCRLYIVQAFLTEIIHSNSFALRLLEECPLPYRVPMGFPLHWKDDPMWRLSGEPSETCLP